MKWYGDIAFANMVETEPDVWEDQPVVKQYFGDLTRSYKSAQQGNTINQNITLGNDLSVLADPFLRQNFFKIEYVTYMGSKWKVSSVTEQWPRLTLSFGDLYNDESTGGKNYEGSD